MDILTGLTAASQAAGLVKQLRDLDKAIDEAGFKAKLVELQEAVFDAKSALLDAKQTILEQSEKLLDLENQVKALTAGESCPVCNVGTLKVTAVRDHPSLSGIGVQERSMRCSNPECGHTEQRVHDPNGILRR